jgi:hypothetical protein
MDAEKRQTPMAADVAQPVYRYSKEPRPKQKKKMLQIYSKEPSNAYGVRQELANGGVVHQGKLSTKFVRRNHK